MRRFILLSLLILIALVIFGPNASDPWDHTSDPSSGVFLRLITAIRDALYLLAELLLNLLNSAWQATPPRYRAIYGILFIAVGVLASVGFVSLGAARGLLRRLLS